MYEWESPTPGSDPSDSCTTASATFSKLVHGCTSLLSGTSGTSPSYLIDADATGANAFIGHRGSLTEDSGKTDKMNAYDVRVDGGVKRVASGCTTGCPAPPPPAATFTMPATSLFSGAGNLLPPQTSGAVKPKPKPLTRAQKLARALKACNARPKRRRAQCRRQARRQYGPMPTHTKKRSTRSSRSGRQARSVREAKS